MTKTEIRKSITQALCEYVKEKYPDYDIEDSEGGRMMIYDTTDPKGDNHIEYSRSQHDVCAFNWCDEKTNIMEKDLNLFLEDQKRKFNI